MIPTGSISVGKNTQIGWRNPCFFVLWVIDLPIGDAPNPTPSWDGSGVAYFHDNFWASLRCSPTQHITNPTDLLGFAVLNPTYKKSLLSGLSKFWPPPKIILLISCFLILGCLNDSDFITKSDKPSDSPWRKSRLITRSRCLVSCFWSGASQRSKKNCSGSGELPRDRARELSAPTTNLQKWNAPFWSRSNPDKKHPLVS